MVVGLGNPGPEYDTTRHNVGWWAVDRLVHDWGFGAFERTGDLLISRGERHGEVVEVIKPTSYMNRSGLALAPRLASASEDFDPSRDLLVVVDDVALEVGRVRLRPQGSPGGHNGLKSIDAVVGGGGYGRLRIGVGACPPGTTLVDWVLSEMEPEDEDQIVELLPMLGETIGVWMLEGAEAAMSRFNR